MRVVLVQFSAGLEPGGNLSALTRWAGEQPSDLLVAPEAMMHDFGPPDLPLGPVAQPLDGPFVAGLASLAVDRRTAIVAGMFERSDDPDRPFNTLVALGPDGQLLGAYRKAHLYDSFGYAESDRLRRGATEACVVGIGGFRVGLMTCYDLRFPEHARALVDAGAELLVVPAAWLRGPLKEDHWATLLRARAIENTVFVAAAAQCGRHYCGRSMLVDPMGVPVAALGEAEGVVAGDIDRDRLTEVRRTNPALTHRQWSVTPGRPRSPR